MRGGMGQLTIKLLRKLDPEQRLVVAAYLFWFSIVGGVYSTVEIATKSYEQILMAISWGAITITCIDVIVGADIRAEQDEK